MIKLLISLFFLFFVNSCKTISNDENINLSEIVVNTSKEIKNKINNNENSIENNEEKNLFYYIGDTYFIEGVKYVPKEDYTYSEDGLASFYDKELHNVRTVNNDFNKVTELLGRHKTLPIPSIVKITNLENGLSLTIKIIDRHDDNASIIQVSRKVAQLLRFYKNKIAKVNVEILPDSSKQWKNVSLVMNEPKFNETISSAPTESVSIINLEDDLESNINSIAETPIEIGTEPIENKDLFLKVYNFKSYQEIQNVLTDLNLASKTTTERNEKKFHLIIGPIDNDTANNLVSSFISKGYKQTEIILK